MNSMTGYGKGSFEADGRKISVEIKSVNHRFLDLSIKMPKILSFAEDNIRKMIKSTINRGHLDVYVNYEDLRKEKAELDVDFSLAKKYYDASEIIARKLGVENDFSVMSLFRLTDIITETAEEADEGLLVMVLEKSLMQALNSLAIMRATEGEMLVSDLLAKVRILRENLVFIKSKAEKIVDEYMIKLRARVSELLCDVKVDETRLLNEVAFMADKMCIDEEILRLTSHYDHFEKLVTQNVSNGRQLDFIVQEMNRETNTIGSKCNDFSLTEKVLLMKNEIEKIREQTQNLE